MKVVVLDDEELALENLIECVEKCKPDAEIVGFQYAEDVLDYLETNTCDCAFLDIEMSGLNGVNLAKILKEKIEILISFSLLGILNIVEMPLMCVLQDIS